jgi:hypothetical protein
VVFGAFSFAICPGTARRHGAASERLAHQLPANGGHNAASPPGRPASAWGGFAFLLLGRRTRTDDLDGMECRAFDTDAPHQEAVEHRAALGSSAGAALPTQLGTAPTAFQAEANRRLPHGSLVVRSGLAMREPL